MAEYPVSVSYPAAVSFPGAFDTDALSFFSRSGITDPSQQNAINTMVVQLKSNNLWTKMLAIYPFVGGSASAHSYNLKSTSYQVTWNGTITHSSSGVQSDGSTGYGTTPLTVNEVSSSGNGGFSAYLNVAPGAGTRGWSGTGNESTARFVTGRYNAGAHTYGLWGGSSASAAIYIESASAGFYSTNRTSTTLITLYKNGGSVATNSTATAYVNPSTSFNLLGSDIGGDGTTTARFAFMAWHQGLDATEAANLYTIVQACQTTLGRAA